MAVLRPTSITGSCESLLVNSDATDLTTQTVARVDVTFEGFTGDIHTGLTRKSCVRVRQQYEEGTEIRNVRQISIMSVEELAEIAAAMGIDRVEPGSVGANLILSGIPSLTLIPPGTRLIFSSGVSLVVDMENEPCRYPGDIIEQSHPGKGRGFAIAAKGRRGITAWVEKEGVIEVGEHVVAHMTPIRAYPADVRFTTRSPENV
ncbi:MAG: MOSC domain-containing protein [Gammaproteobacteria bacterium]|nr:MOSC domain-containing protein [Gammaproteobacteria bacterium]